LAVARLRWFEAAEIRGRVRVRTLRAAALARDRSLFGPAARGRCGIDGQLLEDDVVARDGRLGQIRRAAATLGAMLLGLALTTSVAGAVVGGPDVAVSIAGGGLVRASAASFNWTVIARNHGAATAHDVIVSTTVPAGVALVSPPPACQLGSGVRCSVGDLAPSERVRIELVVHPLDGMCGELRSFATVSASDEPAIAGRDDTAVASASVGCPTSTSDPAPTPDLVVDATSDAAGPIQKGHALRYSLTVTNAGAAVAHHVNVTDRLPPSWSQSTSFRRWTVGAALPSARPRGERRSRSFAPERRSMLAPARR
jgi:uncharacterized repeat protein (TIGR01451 family)